MEQFLTTCSCIGYFFGFPNRESKWKASFLIVVFRNNKRDVGQYTHLPPKWTQGVCHLVRFPKKVWFPTWFALGDAFLSCCP